MLWNSVFTYLNVLCQFSFFRKYISASEFRSSIKSFKCMVNLYQLEYIIRSKIDKFLTITDSQSFSSGSGNDFVDEQTFQNHMHKLPIWDFFKIFQNYMHKLPIWDFLKITCEQYLTTSKEQKLAAIKDYVHAMKNKVSFFVLFVWLKSFYCHL